MISLSLIGCSVEKSEGESVVKKSVELVIRASQGDATRSAIEDEVIEVGAELVPSITTRTELGKTSDSEQQIRWMDKDQIMVWAKPAVNPHGYAFEQTVFSLAYYNHDYHSADFSATVAETLDPDYSYTYYAVYPSPRERNQQGVESAVSGISLNGTTVTYTLSSTQTGEYNPAYDIMRGEVTGAALVERGSSGSVDSWREPELHLSHLLHMVRIRVPADRNLMGRGIKRLEITFPAAVVGGEVSVDVISGQTTWSGQSNKVTIDLADNNLLDEGSRDVWVQVRSGVELNGQISFQAYDDYGVPTQVISSKSINNKTLLAGHITPINLTIPSSKYEKIVYLDFVVDKNNLGEPLKEITLSGCQFVSPFTIDKVESISINRGSDDSNNTRYQVFQVVVADGVENLKDKKINISYKSENALISNRTITITTSPITIEDTTITPLATSLSTNSVNKINMVVPYLYYEDFSSVKSKNSYNYEDWQWSESTGTHKGSEISSLSGWTGARWQIDNGSISVSAYTGTPVSKGTFAYGRIDSPALSNLKNNKDILVSFDYISDLEKGGTSGFAAVVYFGISETSGVINGTAKGDNTLPDKYNAQTITVEDENFEGTISNLKIENCSNISRLSWCNNITDSMTRSTAFFTVKNIKVSIAQ